MRRTDFNAEILERRLQLIREHFLRNNPKNTEYADDDEVFRNFKNAVGLSFGNIPEKVAWEFMTKHLQSIKDILDMLEAGDCYMGYPKEEMVEEKIGDAINYLILIEGMLKERIVEYQAKKLDDSLDNLKNGFLNPPRR